MLATTTDTTTDTAEVLFELGVFEVTDAVADALLGGAARIALILVGSLIITRIGHRLIRKGVDGVRAGDQGPLDRIRHRRETWEADDRGNAIAHARRVSRAEAMASVGRSVVSVTVWTLATFSILSTVRIELGPYIAGLGIVGVALGFGAQDLVKDFISGVFMLLEDQYGIGDVIDAGEATGAVEGISLRTTRIRSVDGTLWYVPNGEIRRLGNMSQGWARALLDIGVAYDTDIDHASEVILGVATTMAEEQEFAAKFLDEPKVLGVENLGPDAIDIRLLIQTTPGDQWLIGRELRRRLKVAFDREGIEIPFQQRTLWIRTEDGASFPAGAAAATDD